MSISLLSDEDYGKLSNRRVEEQQDESREAGRRRQEASRPISCGKRPSGAYLR